MNEKDIRKEERGKFIIVLESLRSDFRVFGKVLGGVSNGLETVENF
ncbi:hypothetical protein ACFLY7_01250 [Patescibacteria group bacterium]